MDRQRISGFTLKSFSVADRCPPVGGELHLILFYYFISVEISCKQKKLFGKSFLYAKE